MDFYRHTAFNITKRLLKKAQKGYNNYILRFNAIAS